MRDEEYLGLWLSVKLPICINRHCVDENYSLEEGEIQTHHPRR